MNTITIELPIPPKILNANGRTRSLHFRASKVKKYRTDAVLCSLAALDRRDPPRFKKALVRCAWYFQSNRNRYDPNNLDHWIKAGIDGIQDAEIIINDRHAIPGGHTQHTDAANPRVEVTLERLDDDDVPTKNN
jgi:hypothetical protein